MSYSEPYPAPAVAAEPHSRAAPRWLSGVLGLVLTPVALGLLSYGGFRAQPSPLGEVVADRDAPGVALLAGGAILLLVVAALGAWSSTGPLAGGLVWGVLPGVIGLAMPRWDLDLLRLLPDELRGGALRWLFSGGLIAAGFLLVGTGLAATLVRRRR
ncbi:hypothetical protein [Amycolatopsis sp. PS_44_ISF1]|uniref:hypothetical protein n=1 Tax=Amycolatopsis sp. PS_44_ISF1 TaxID=2974917 RepID=UPI0028DFFB7B|nr:hypothetical protein [Amycolatopsis sp. PS_44_ISF1]MDT8909608.1 hypothetical protein [Amycolatopsis sp. PS_44_ISF1]